MGFRGVPKRSSALSGLIALLEAFLLLKASLHAEGCFVRAIVPYSEVLAVRDKPPEKGRVKALVVENGIPSSFLSEKGTSQGAIHFIEYISQETRSPFYPKNG